ncbi:MAG: response regulator [Gammaproteobacteria bacterium]|nr:response regulator [Gammaproteobacteria bacterium]
MVTTRRWWSWLLAALLGLSGPVAATPVVLAIDQQWCGSDEGPRALRQFLVEFWQQLASLADLEPSFRCFDLPLQAVADGRADIAPLAYYQAAEGTPALWWTTPYLDLNPARNGVVDDSAPQVSVARALQLGQGLPVVVSQRWPAPGANSASWQLDYQPLSAAEHLDAQWRVALRAAVTPAKYDLALDLNHGLRRLSPFRVSRLAEQYLQGLPALTPRLAGMQPNILPFEAHWLLHHPEVAVLTADASPLIHWFQQRPQGYSVAVLESLAQRAGFTLRYLQPQADPADERAWIDPLAVSGGTIATDSLLTEPYLVVPLASLQPASGDADKLTLVVNGSGREASLLLTAMAGAEVRTVQSDEEALALVAKGSHRWLAGAYRMLASQGQWPAGVELVELPDSSGIYRHFAIHDGQLALWSLLNNGLRTLDEAYRRTLLDNAIAPFALPPPWYQWLARNPLQALTSALVVLVLAGWGVASRLALNRQRRVQALLRSAVANADEARRQAEEAGNAKVSFLARMSHEIRTPLNGVLGMAEALQHSALDAGQRERLGVLQQSARALLAILNDILDFAKLDAQQMRLEAQPIDLRVLLERVEATFRFAADSKNLLLVVQFDERLHQAYRGDPVRLQQIANNLTANAVKFTQDGWVEISLVVVRNLGQRDLLELQVSDTGPGIDEDQRAKLFSPFYQVENYTTRKAGGTGLGLSICREIANAMGAELGLESSLGQGSVFSLRFWAERSDEIPVNRELIEPEPLAIDGQQLRVLVAEDNAVNLQVLKGQLERLGIEPDVAGNGLDAYLLCAEHQYQLVLSDCHMPQMDGFELATRLKANGPSCPILVAVTADAVGDALDRCYAAGFDAYLAKPVAFEHLSAKIAELMARFPERFRAGWQSDLAQHSALPEVTSERVPAVAALRQRPAASTPAPAPAALPGAEAKAPADQPLLDLVSALVMVGDDPGLLTQVLDSYLADSPDDLAALVVAANSGNWPQLRELAHKFKGSARYFGAAAVARQCELLEQAARAADAASTANLLPALQQQLAVVEREVRAWLAVNRC